MKLGGDGNMRIGIPKEIKTGEYRVGTTPAGVRMFKEAGHEVYVQSGAGLGSGISDEQYQAAGAIIVPTLEDVYATAEMIYKVKEPQPAEYQLLREGQVLFAFLHLAAEPELTKVLQEKGVVAVAFETVELPDGSLPMLSPMSEVAGRMALQIAAHLMEKAQGGRGMLLGGVPGVPPAEVVILGGGTVGTNAAKMAIGLGARVTIIDKSLPRLRYLDDIFGSRITTLVSNTFNIADSVGKADVVIGAVLVSGYRAPRLVSEDMVKTMQPGSVIVDVAVDQGGCIETVDRATTHEEPTYIRHGVVHYAVANIPGQVPRTSTFALANATLPYALELATKGYRQVLAENNCLAKGFNVIHGKIVHRGVAEAHGLPYTPWELAS
jgi:alanine dehydrogenase